MAKGYFSDIFGSLSAVDHNVRDRILGWNSPLWESMCIQRKKNSVTDTFILLSFRICKNNGNYTTPILTEPNRDKIATSLGLQVANVIRDADLIHCKIAQYSINANNVGKEASNNRLSLAVYAHFDEPMKNDEVYKKILEEIDANIIEPINGILAEKDAQIRISHGYSSGNLISNYAELDELLMYGDGSMFPQGYF